MEVAVQEILIERWWVHLDVHAKQWLREHLRAEDIPDRIVTLIAEAGGNVEEPVLSEQDWQFVETQSEFVD